MKNIIFIDFTKNDIINDSVPIEPNDYCKKRIKTISIHLKENGIVCDNQITKIFYYPTIFYKIISKEFAKNLPITYNNISEELENATLPLCITVPNGYTFIKTYRRIFLEMNDYTFNAAQNLIILGDNYPCQLATSRIQREDWISRRFKSNLMNVYYYHLSAEDKIDFNQIIKIAT